MRLPRCAEPSTARPVMTAGRTPVSWTSRRGRVPRLLAAGVLGVLLAACGSSPMTASSPGATATLESRSGSAVTGSVRFFAVADGVRVSASVRGLPSNGEHGFHVHENGDCSSPDAMSAGGHFNPHGHPHGPQGAARHAGDMPSLKADATGRAETTFLLSGVGLGSGPADLKGKAVIVHAKPDDYRTQPTGNAGGRLACGVIQ